MTRTAIGSVGQDVSLGLLASLGLSRAITSQLFGMSAHDPAMLASVALLLLVIGPWWPCATSSRPGT